MVQIISPEFAYIVAAGIITPFVILDPIGVIPFFQSLTRDITATQSRKVAKRSVMISMILLLILVYLGEILLSLLGITIYDFEIDGGALLLVFAIRDALSNEPLGMSKCRVTRIMAQFVDRVSGTSY